MSSKQPQRHTYSVIAALEDAIALQWEIIRVLATALKVARQKTIRTMQILKAARQGPHAYDPDQPSNKKITVRKK